MHDKIKMMCLDGFFRVLNTLLRFSGHLCFDNTFTKVIKKGKIV